MEGIRNCDGSSVVEPGSLTKGCLYNRESMLNHNGEEQQSEAMLDHAVGYNLPNDKDVLLSSLSHMINQVH
jgi:hypothetical protein